MVNIENKYKFPCGCEFEIVEDAPKDCDGLPSLHIDYYNLPEDCPATWELIQSGHTKGIFQLENNLGRKWAKEIMPSNIGEMSALISLMRPGCLRSLIEGKSMTQHYADRKRGDEPVEYFHESLNDVLNTTYGVLTYQEQSMLIARKLAGFSLSEAEVLRKGIGKKLPEILIKLESKFIDGCKKVGLVNEEEAKAIFGWIREGQKYLFNLSHGVLYGTIGYWTAYVKAHFPLHFYTAWLHFAHEKQKPHIEVQLLVSDARYFQKDIMPPSLAKVLDGDEGCVTLAKEGVYFGIGDIKKIGSASVTKCINRVREVENIIGKGVKDWTWHDFLFRMSDSVGQTVVNNIIAAGATDYMGFSRSRKISEFNVWMNLTAKEREWITQQYNGHQTLKSSIILLLTNRSKTTANRKSKIEDQLKTLESDSFSKEDTTWFIASHEQELLGIPITCTKLDNCKQKYSANTTCKEFLQGKSGKNISIAVEITEVKEVIISKGDSKGKKMCFLTVEDSTAQLDSVMIFTETMEANLPLLIVGETVILYGQRDYKTGKTFIVNEIQQI